MSDFYYDYGTATNVVVPQVSLKMQDTGLIDKRKTVTITGPNGENVDFPDVIMAEAEIILTKFPAKMLRTGNITRRNFAALYYAYRVVAARIGNPDIIPDAREIGAKIGLDPKDMQGALSKFSNPYKGEFTPVSVQVTPLSPLRTYADSLGIGAALNPEAWADLSAVATRILESDKTLLQQKPAGVAAGILNYYITFNNTGFTEEDVTRVSGYRGQTLKTFTESASSADNSG